MKPIREWLNELPTPYREQAIENWEKYENDVKREHRSSAENALCAAFDWGSTE